MSQVNRLPAAMARRVDFEDAVSPRVIHNLRERIELLEEENLQLREAARPVVSFPVEWRLTREEGRFLAVLFRSRSEYLSKERLLTALYGLEADVDIKIIDVWTHKIRKKLADAGTGVEILTHWGRGYGLSSEGRAVLRTLVPQGEKDDATRIRELEATVEQLTERAVDLMADVDRLRAVAKERAGLERDVARLRSEFDQVMPVPSTSRFPLAWGLSRQMVAFLACLMDAEGYVSRERLCRAVLRRT